MNVSYDSEVDALTISVDDSTVEVSDEIAPGLIVDYDREGKIVGFEVLNFGRKLRTHSTVEPSIILSPAKLGIR